MPPVSGRVKSNAGSIPASVSTNHAGAQHLPPHNLFCYNKTTESRISDAYIRSTENRRYSKYTFPSYLSEVSIKKTQCGIRTHQL